MTVRHLFANRSGASAAEFALVLPLFILFLVAMIDMGRYIWETNQAEKATQAGARFAVVTDVVDTGLSNAGLVGTQVNGVFLTQGDRIPIDALGTLTCNTTICTCTGTCPGTRTYNSAAFDNIVARMRAIYPEITDQNVTVEYHGSGLGYAGDPNGMDLSPMVTVKLSGINFTPTAGLRLATVAMPAFATTLTAEDALGTQSN